MQATIDNYYDIMSVADIPVALTMLYIAHRHVRQDHAVVKRIRLLQLCNNKMVNIFVAKIILSSTLVDNYPITAEDVPLAMEDGLMQYITPEVFLKYKNIIPRYALESAYLPEETRHITGFKYPNDDNTDDLNTIEGVITAIPLKDMREHLANSLHFRSLEVTLHFSDPEKLGRGYLHPPSIQVLDYAIDNGIVTAIPHTWISDKGFTATRHAWDRGLRLNMPVSASKVIGLTDHKFVDWIITNKVPVRPNSPIDIDNCQVTTDLYAHYGTLLAFAHYGTTSTKLTSDALARFMLSSHNYPLKHFKSISVTSSEVFRYKSHNTLVMHNNPILSNYDVRYIAINLYFRDIQPKGCPISVTRRALDEGVMLIDSRRSAYNILRTTPLTPEEVRRISYLSKSKSKSSVLIMYDEEKTISHIAEGSVNHLISGIELNQKMFAKYLCRLSSEEVANMFVRNCPINVHTICQLIRDHPDKSAIISALISHSTKRPLFNLLDTSNKLND